MNTKKNKKTDSPHFREFFLDRIKDVYLGRETPFVRTQKDEKGRHQARSWPPHSRNTSRRPQARSNG
ncbi:MAG: hypothetical protein ACLUFW_05960 [Alistipes sp.]